MHGACQTQPLQKCVPRSRLAARAAHDLRWLEITRKRSSDPSRWMGFGQAAFRAIVVVCGTQIYS